MSMVVVTRGTINKVVVEFALQEREEWLEAGPHGWGAVLWDLNEQCFYKRYPYDASDKGLPAFEFDPTLMPYTPIERLKACHCLYYQYVMGEMTHLEVAEALRDVIIFAEQFITYESPGYTEAPWDE